MHVVPTHSQKYAFIYYNITIQYIVCVCTIYLQIYVQIPGQHMHVVPTHLQEYAFTYIYLLYYSVL